MNMVKILKCVNEEEGNCTSYKDIFKPFVYVM